jgi:hypothetical protein
VSPAVLFVDIVPVEPVSVRTVGFCWSLDTARNSCFSHGDMKGRDMKTGRLQRRFEEILAELDRLIDAVIRSKDVDYLGYSMDYLLDLETMTLKLRKKVQVERQRLLRDKTTPT